MIARGDAPPSTGIASGLARLDAITGGFQPGELTLMAGRPGNGKTALAISIALEVASARTGVLFVGLTDPTHHFVCRFLAAHIGLGASVIENGFLTETAWDRLKTGCAEVSALPLFIEGGSNLDVAELRRGILWNDDVKGQLGLIVLDDLRMLGVRQRDDESAAADPLKRLAEELAIPILATWPLEAHAVGPDCLPPTLFDLRRSGFRRDADTICLIDGERESDPGPGALVAPVRVEMITSPRGPSGWIWLERDLESCRIRSPSSHT